MEKLLITGAAGFVGSELCRLALNKEYQVRAVDNFYKGHCDSLTPLCSNSNFEFMFGDVSDEESAEKMCDGVDGVINLAAIVGFPMCAKYPKQAEIINYGGVMNLLAARDIDAPFVQASTGSQYGKIEGICTEDSPQNTNTVYGLTKMYAERLCLESENTVSLRFATGFGLSHNMRVNLLLNDLTVQAINNRVLNIFEADAKRTFIHVRDMAVSFIMAYEKLRDRTLSHRIYNVGHNTMNASKRDVAELLKQRTGCTVFYVDNQKDPDCRDYEVDYSRWINEGFDPSVSVEQGIDEMIKSVPTLNLNRYYQ